MNKDFKYYRPLKYSEYKITFSEVPDEVSLNFSLTGCDIKCKNCHSKYLWNYENGKLLETYDFLEILEKYKEYITCICFMGEDKNRLLLRLCKNIRTIYEDKYKICIYSGNNDISINLKEIVDYYKVGPYIEEKGSLRSKSTNQKMFKKDGINWIDITHKFWK